MVRRGTTTPLRFLPKMTVSAAGIVATFHVFKLLTNDDLAVLRLWIDLRVLGRA